MRKVSKKLRLLIADDHELVRHGIRGILDGHNGWAVVGEADDGDEAVRMAEHLQPDLAIVDITMPRMDGLEATRRIQTVAPRTKILILSMHESDQMVRRVLEAGAKGYVLKSDLAATLVKAVGDISRGKRTLTPKVSEIVLQGFLKAEKEPKRTEEPKAKPTPRELEIIRLMAQGKANKEIASALKIATRTVEAHRAQIMNRLNLHSTAEVVRYAIRQKIVEA
jgi:DNA-binding NarL/FixJ family response regulator